MTEIKLILASSSPRRQLLMKEVGYDFEVRTTEVDEAIFMKPPPEKACVNAAIAKAKAIPHSEAEIILAADTLVWFNNQIIGKAKSDAEAIKMLGGFSNQWLDIYTGLALLANGKIISEFAWSRLKFRIFSEAEVRAYVKADLSRGRAGSFTVRGYGSTFIEKIEGELSNIEGLPMQTVFKLLKARGILPKPEKSAYRRISN